MWYANVYFRGPRFQMYNYLAPPAFITAIFFKDGGGQQGNV